jgi:hypothetical protein
LPIKTWTKIIQATFLFFLFCICPLENKPKDFRFLSLFFSLYRLWPKKLGTKPNNSSPHASLFGEGSTKPACLGCRIQHIIIGMNLLNNKRFYFHSIYNSLISNLNVLWSRIKSMILTKINCILTVVVQHEVLLYLVKYI